MGTTVKVLLAVGPVSPGTGTGSVVAVSVAWLTGLSHVQPMAANVTPRLWLGASVMGTEACGGRRPPSLMALNSMTNGPTACGPLLCATTITGRASGRPSGAIVI